MICLSRKSKTPDIQITESLLPTFTVTLKHSQEYPLHELLKMLNKNQTAAYTSRTEIEKGKSLIHFYGVSEEERTVPTLSHESLHLTLGHLGEFDASGKLDEVGHGYYPELDSSGITQRKLRDSKVDSLARLLGIR